MLEPTAILLAHRATRAHAGSARPGAPVVPDAPDRPPSRVRAGAAVALRSAAGLQARLADRLDPARVLDADPRCWQ